MKLGQASVANPSCTGVSLSSESLNHLLRSSATSPLDGELPTPYNGNGVNRGSNRNQVGVSLPASSLTGCIFSLSSVVVARRMFDL